MADCRNEVLSETRRRRRMRRLTLRMIRVGAAICALLLALGFGFLHVRAADQPLIKPALLTAAQQK